MTTFASRADECVSLSLLDAFELRCDGEPVSLPPSAQRLLALLALHDRPLLRPHVAGTLWLDTPEERASANLPAPRSGGSTAPARGSSRRRPSSCASRPRFGSTRATAAPPTGCSPARSGRPRTRPSSHSTPTCSPASCSRTGTTTGSCSSESGCASSAFPRSRRWANGCSPRQDRRDALEAALAAIAMEPLRESAHRLLIGVPLAEGNAARAIREFELCCRLFPRAARPRAPLRSWRNSSRI